MRCAANMPARFVCTGCCAVCLHAIVSVRGMFVGVFCQGEACLSVAACLCRRVYCFFDR